MKKIKIFIFVFLFIGIIEVKAEVKECKYDRNIVNGNYGANLGSGATIILNYDSDTQKITGSLKDFEVNNSYKTYNISNIKLDNLKKEDFMDSSGNLVCPKIAVKDECTQAFEGDMLKDFCWFYAVKDEGSQEQKEQGYQSAPENSSVVTKYVLINNNKKVVSIYKTDNNYYLSVNSQSIANSNIEQVKSSFESGVYLTYLVKDKNGNYTFTNDSGQNTAGTITEIYINENKLSNGTTNLSKYFNEGNMPKTCEELFGNELLKWLDENVFMLIRIAVPVILILLTSYDFSKVVFNDDKDGMPSALKRFYKRAIAAVLIFLTPTIIITISHLVGSDEINSCVETMNSWTEGDW